MSALLLLSYRLPAWQLTNLYFIFSLTDFFPPYILPPSVCEWLLVEWSPLESLDLIKWYTNAVHLPFIHGSSWDGPSDSCSCTVFHINWAVWRKRQPKYARPRFDKSKYSCAYVLFQFCLYINCQYEGPALFPYDASNLCTTFLPVSSTELGNLKFQYPHGRYFLWDSDSGFHYQRASTDCQLWSSNKRSFVQANFQFDSFSVAAVDQTFCLKTAVLPWQKLYAVEEMTFNSADMYFPSTPPLSDTQPLTAPCKK